jgi:phage-related protein
VKSVVLAGWTWLKGLKNQFFSAGADLINGLVNGITAKLSSARDAIVGFGSSIKGWFTNTLGIKSPSRVFMGFGDNIAQGAAIGIGRSSALASKAAGGMANDTLAAAASKRLHTARTGSSSGAAGVAGAGINIHFNPVIQLPTGAADSVRGQVSEALQLSVRELEKMIERVVAEKSRRAY